MELADLFASKRATVVDWEGDRAYSIFDVTDLPERIVVRIFADTTDPEQGVRLSISNGSMEIDGVTTTEAVLWADSGVQEYPVTVRPGARPAGLQVWNCWRGALGSVDAWLRNAGMRVDVTAERITLRCSDGIGAASFSDLVVEIDLVEPLHPGD